MNVYQYFSFDGTLHGVHALGVGAFQEVVMATGKSERLAELAKRHAAESGITYAAALSEISREQPRLAAEAKAEVTGVTVRGVETSGMIGRGLLSDSSIEPDEELLLLAKDRASKKGLSLSEALREVGRDHRGLVRLYREDVKIEP